MSDPLIPNSPNQPHQPLVPLEPNPIEQPEVGEVSPVTPEVVLETAPISQVEQPQMVEQVQVATEAGPVPEQVVVNVLDEAQSQLASEETNTINDDIDAVRLAAIRMAEDAVGTHDNDGIYALARTHYEAEQANPI